LRLNIALNCSEMRSNTLAIAVLFPMKVALMSVAGTFCGTLHTVVLMLFGIHSTKYALFLACTFCISSSTACVDTLPRKMADAVR